MDLIQAVILGLVQGLTEFLPISSSAHLRIVPALLGWQDPGAAFTAVIQIGTLVAVLVFFRKDLAAAFMGWAKSLTDRDARKTNEARMGWAIFVGTLPIVIIGLAFKDFIEGDAIRSLYVVSTTLIVMGVLLFVAERVGSLERRIDDVTVKDGLWVGLWQALALVPGCSRSGSTISGALLSGFDRPTAARFSFLLSVPSILAAAVLEAWSEREEIFQSQLAPTIVATIAAFISGYWAIGFLIRYLQTRSALVFVVYRVALGVILLGLLAGGVLTPMEGARGEGATIESSHVSP